MAVAGNRRPPIAIGVLGGADIATRRVLPAIVAHPQLRLVAVGSRSLSKAQAITARFGGDPLEGYESVLERRDVDAVYIPVPIALHPQWTRSSLLAGKHVLVEKPLATTGQDAEELLGLAQRAGLVLMENFMFLHHSQHREIRRRLGAIGELRRFSATFTVPARDPGDIRYRADLGGGALLDVGVYPLRAAILLLGADLGVSEASLGHSPAYQVDLEGNVVAHRADGVAVQLAFGMRHQYRSTYQVVGSRGQITLDHAFTPPPQHAPVIRIDDPAGSRSVSLPADDQCANTISALVRAICNGATGGDGAIVALARILDDIRQLATVHHPLPLAKRTGP